MHVANEEARSSEARLIAFGVLDFGGALRRLQQRRICVSFTILILPLIVDVSRHNGIDWDAVIPCEMLRVYTSTSRFPRPIDAPQGFSPSRETKS